MSFKTLSKWFANFLIVLLCISSLNAQSAGLSDEQFTEQLKSYIDQLLTRYGQETVEKERFLVQQIRMINEEIKSRVGNVAEKRTQYFDRLQLRLNEIKALKSRLPGSGGQLSNFIDDLENRIKQTINNGVMDYQRQQVFDDAMQLLYLAEELIKLDPATNLNVNPQIVEGISKTNQKIVNTFGTTPSPSASFSGSTDNATIFDVYNEWQRTERIKYHVRLTDIQIIKKRFIKNATVTDLDRMFRRELQHAVEAYNFGYYELAEMSFEEIRNSYSEIGELDDVLFYQANCNYLLGRYNKSEELFKQIIRRYPSSAFVPQTYKRLIEISIHFERYSDAVDHFRQMQSIVSTTDENYQEALLMAINASLNGGFYEDAVSLAYEISPQSPLYNYARFIQAKALVGAQNLEEANTVLTSILQTSNLEPQFRFAVLAKLGYLSYELGQPQTAVNYFNQIGGNYKNYDRVLMGYSWAFYKTEIDKVPSSRDFTNAEKYLNTLINGFPNSEYSLEARTLLGYIDQLQMDVNDALSNFRYAYNAKEIKLLSDDLNAQQNKLEEIVSTSAALERKALESKNLEAFNRAIEMREKVEEPLFKLKYSDLSPVGMAARNQISRLTSQADELDRLKQKALEKNDDLIVDRIEEMQLKIYRAINSYPDDYESALGFNYFDEHPLARKESVVENENKRRAEIRQDTRRQRDEIARKISRLDVEIANAKSRRDYKKLADLEISRERFVDLLDNLDYVETWVYSMKMHGTNINLNRWSDYGAFGMANVNFAVRQQQKEQVGLMREQIQKINELLMRRKENVEHKIGQITDEITLMTRRVRRQERIREREELNRQFEESYFDTHETESENPNLNDNTLPPSFDDESDE